MLKTECSKYGVEYIDTAENRENILEQIINMIEKDNR